MKVRLLASVAMIYAGFLGNMAAEPALPKEDLSASGIVERMIEQDEKNHQIAKHYEYDQQTVTEKLDSEEKTVDSKTQTAKQRLQKGLSYKVEGMKRGNEGGTEVAIGSAQTDEDSSEGTYFEMMTMRELSQYYDFQREKDEKMNGTLYYVLSFKPKDRKQAPEAKSRNEKVMVNLIGKIWVDPVDFVIVVSDSRLAAPMPFAIIDLVSLRSLHIRYEAFKLDQRVWLPKSVEVSYQVRILYLGMIRERQRSTMTNFIRVTEE